MRIAFCAHPRSSAAQEQRDACIPWLAAQGASAVHVDTNRLHIDSGELLELAQEIGELSLVCALGGDGTILRATRLAYTAGVPLLGINFGHLGFLSGATATAMQAALKAFLAGELHEERRVMLNANVSFSDGSTAEFFALNEVVLGKEDMGRVIYIEAALNDHRLPVLRGDGVIVATATGSTGYAHSAGGPLLSPENQGLCMVPLSSLGFNAAALVSAPDDVIRLTPLSHNDQHALLCIDGQTLDADNDSRLISSVVVTRAARDMTLLRYDAPDFYTRIAHSLAGDTHVG